MRLTVMLGFLMLLSGCDRMCGPLIESRLDQDAEVYVLYGTGETSNFKLKPCTHWFLGGINQPVPITEVKVTYGGKLLVDANSADVQDIAAAQGADAPDKATLYIAPAGISFFDPAPEKCPHS